MKTDGVFKKARPARPQLLWRAERTEGYVSTTKGRERRWRTFSTLLYMKKISVAMVNVKTAFLKKGVYGGGDGCGSLPHCL